MTNPISGLPSAHVGARATLIHADCLDWLAQQPPRSIHAVVTDPPFGLHEFTDEEKDKLAVGRGGTWRIPPAIGGVRRMPVPRFTTLSTEDVLRLRTFFVRWTAQLVGALVPGAHVFVASNPLVSHVTFDAIASAGLERRGEVVRLVQTLRGGDRPKGAESEFPVVSAMARSAHEPWGIFRKPLEGTLAECLRRWGTGGLRRESAGRPFTDVIACAPTRAAERAISPHPNLKPQRFMRQIVRAALPLGRGVVLDPFAGGGSTLAAAEWNGYESVGVEKDAGYFEIAREAVGRLAGL